MSQLQIFSDWLAPHTAEKPFEDVPHDALVQILMLLEPHEILAFAMTCKKMNRLLYLSLTHILYQAVQTGCINLTYIVEHKPFIERIREFIPDFEPFPCDYDNYDEEDDYDSEAERAFWDIYGDADEEEDSWDPMDSSVQEHYSDNVIEVSDHSYLSYLRLEH